MEIKKIDVECVDVFWDKVEHWIESATKKSRGRHTLESTRKLLLSGNMEMFLVLVNKAICAVYVVKKTFYPAKSVLSILFCGGSKVIRNIKKIENYDFSNDQSEGHKLLYKDFSKELINKNYSYKTVRDSISVLDIVLSSIKSHNENKVINI